MVILWHDNSFRITILLWGNSTSDLRIPFTKAQLFTLIFFFDVSLNKMLNEWWKWYRFHTGAQCGCIFVCQVTYLPTSLQDRPQYELSYRSYLWKPIEFENIFTEKQFRTPYELAHWVRSYCSKQQSPVKCYLCNQKGVTCLTRKNP